MGLGGTEAERRPPLTLVLGGLLDLTRMSWFGPFVVAAFALGAVAGFHELGRFDGWDLLKILVGGSLGFAGGFVLNDWADSEQDRVLYAGRELDQNYQKQLRRERPFTKGRPIPAGIVTSSQAFLFALLLYALAGAVACSFPSPHHWYLLGLMVYTGIGEPLYCVVKRRQGRTPFATVLTATLLGLTPLAGYLALGHPGLLALAIFLVLVTWELGHNQAYDIIDYENDKRRNLRVATVMLGLDFVARWVFVNVLLHLGAVVFLGLAARMGWIYLGITTIGAIPLLIATARLLKNPDVPTGQAVHDQLLYYLMVILVALVANALAAHSGVAFLSRIARFG